MSGFFGIFRPQGGSVDLDAFEQMRKATELEGFDGLDTHVEEKIAMGHLMLRVSPEAKYDQQPLRSECGRYLLVGHFRLDYRDELGDKLGLIQSELELTPDSTLVMLAYQKWKDQCVNHIEGDWAFALHDSTLNTVFFAKDKLGYSALYYTQIGDELYFASDGNLFKKILKVDFQTDLSQLQRLFIPGLKLRPGTTLVKEILYLNSGSIMNIDSSLKNSFLNYWTLTEQLKIKFRNDADVIQEFRSIFSRAIHSRLRSSEKAGIFLSSGIDSNTVAYFASEEFRKRELDLFSYTSCPAFLHEIPKEKHERVSEQFFLERQLLSRPSIKPQFLSFSDASLGEILSSNKTSDLLFPIITNNTLWIDGILNKAKHDGVKTILNGQMGNFTLSWDAPNYLLYLFMRFKFSTFFSEILALKRNRNVALISLLKGELIKPFIKYVIKFIKNVNPFYGQVFFRGSILDRYLDAPINWLKERNYLGFVPGFDITLQPERLRKKIIVSNAPMLGIKWYKESHHNNIIVTDATIDVRLLEFTFSAVGNFFFRKGVKKFLVKNMMQGLISDEILFYRGLFPQTYDVGFRLQNDNLFHDLLKNIKLDAPLNSKINIMEVNELWGNLLESGDNIKKMALSSQLLKNISLINSLKNKC
jgi:asparagine synthase (glutamine-hydrolysing)